MSQQHYNYCGDDSFFFISAGDNEHNIFEDAAMIRILESGCSGYSQGSDGVFVFVIAA